LVRRICAECRVRYRPDPAAAALLAGRPMGDLVLERGRGCAACRDTGFRGRIGIFELLTMTDELRRELLSTSSLPTLRQIAREQGMRGLREDGWLKVQAGLTTVEEVLRVIQG
jgi:type II secretory ATPase GspE/PulE/Tfp pilus assembly ATPase PilB-like protein